MIAEKLTDNMEKEAGVSGPNLFTSIFPKY